MPHLARVSRQQPRQARPGLDSGVRGPVIYCLPGQQVAGVFLVCGAFRSGIGCGQEAAVRSGGVSSSKVQVESLLIGGGGLSVS